MNDYLNKIKSGPLVLSSDGERIAKRGGDDGKSDDDMLLIELMAAAPGCTMAQYGGLFMEMREKFGEDARRVLREGHVQFRRGGERR